MIAPLLSVLVASAALSVPTAHAAEDACVPETNQAPQWWNPALGPAQKEARWSGAVSRTQKQSPYAARVRMIWKPAQETVYFEHRVQRDAALDPDDDVVLFALGDETGTQPELFIRFFPVKGCSNVADCTGAGAALPASAVEFSEATPSGTSITWSPLSNTNPGGDFVVEHPWVAVEQVGSTYTWTFSFALEVPVVGGEIRPDLRVYGNAVVYEPGPTSGTLFEFPLLCTSSSVTSNDCLIYGSPGAEVPFDLPIGNLEDSWPFLESGACDQPVLVIVP